MDYIRVVGIKFFLIMWVLDSGFKLSAALSLVKRAFSSGDGCFWKFQCRILLSIESLQQILLPVFLSNQFNLSQYIIHIFFHWYNLKRDISWKLKIGRQFVKVFSLSPLAKILVCWKVYLNTFAGDLNFWFCTELRWKVFYENHKL